MLVKNREYHEKQNKANCWRELNKMKEDKTFLKPILDKFLGTFNSALSGYNTRNTSPVRAGTQFYCIILQAGAFEAC